MKGFKTLILNMTFICFISTLFNASVFLSHCFVSYSVCSFLCFCLHCPFKFSVYFYLESRRKGGTDPELFNASIGTSVLLNNFLNADKQEVHADKI